MSDAPTPEASPTAPAQRPLWRWILRALSPSLVYVVFASLSFLVPPITVLSMFAGLIVPVVTLIVLIKVADDFFTARSDRSEGRRVLFVLGFGIVNAMIWFGGCGITAFNLGPPLPLENSRSRPPVERKADEPPAATPSSPPPSP